MVFDGCVPDLAMAMVDAQPYEECCKEEIIPYFRKASDFTVISMVDVIEASGSDELMQELRKKVRDKYVFVGATDETLKDIGPTPSGLVEPLVFLHLNRAEALLNGITIKNVPWWFIAAVPLIILMILGFFFEHARVFLITGFISVPLVYGAGYLLFRNGHFYIPSMELFFPFFFANMAGAGYQIGRASCRERV